MKTDFVKKLTTGLLLALSLLISYTAMGAFNSTITVKVVDAETDEPIEGAVVLVQWTKTTGFGFKATSIYKLVELVSDKNGELTIPGVFKLGASKPMLVVYKKGYVAWRNEYIFPSYERRTNFHWRDGYVFRLEHFKAEYSHKDHVSFLDRSNSSLNMGLL
ncbi:MAG: hypothetical protein DRI46_11675, partial [Chloroflexi bacterium]